MFGHRPDGKKIKKLPPIFKIMPCVMLDRADSQVYFKQDIALRNLDEYIDKKAKEGIRLSYMNIIYAALVRIIGQRPNLNRFAMNGALYERDKIYVSLVIKKSLTDDGPETPVKLDFNGNESLFEIKDKLVNVLNIMPSGLISAVVKFLMFLDRHGLLARKIIDASPFHTSVFLTNVGSLGIDSIYHHIYNFGTTSMFFSMGKKKKSYIYEDDEIKEEKCITLAFVGDERICDGYYYASSFKLLSKYLKKPELLEELIEEKDEITN